MVYDVNNPQLYITIENSHGPEPKSQATLTKW
jgi:hypothetical protein